MLKITKVETSNAPLPVGNYSQAIIAGDFVFCSGQIAIEPISGQIISGDISEQVEQVISNLINILISAKSSLDRVVRVEVYLKNMDDFEKMDAIYSKHFIKNPKPSRVTVEVSRLPKNALIEMSCVALKK
jgi:2-iminobutanoate/2-iminopropanoate deaminase